MYKAFLIKYGEIGVKGKNRYLFEDALAVSYTHLIQRHVVIRQMYVHGGAMIAVIQCMVQHI